MHRVIQLLAVLSLAFAPAPVYRPKPDTGKDDLKAMQGSWVIHRSHNPGVSEDVDGTGVWTFEGDVLTTSRGGKKVSTSYARLDGTTRPGSIDLYNRREGDPDPAQGRYRVEGDTLTVCIGPGVRPRDLSGFGPSNGVWVYKRMKTRP
jgi:uncharacterized protein (TIGR03067 family)